MAVPALLFRRQLGEGLAKLGKIKEWIVAEATLSARLREDLTLGLAFKRSHRLAVFGGGNYTYIFPRKRTGRKAFQLSDQGAIIGLIIGIPRY